MSINVFEVVVVINVAFVFFVDGAVDVDIVVEVATVVFTAVLVTAVDVTVVVFVIVIFGPIAVA